MGVRRTDSGLVLADWRSLLGIPWELGGRDPEGSLDCLGLSRVVNIMAGYDVREIAFPCSYENLGEAVSVSIARTHDCWDRLGAHPSNATEIGDTIYSATDQSHPHATVVIQTCPVLALTTDELRGVTKIRPVFVGGSLGVYRLKNR